MLSTFAIGQKKSEPINNFCYYDSKEDMQNNKLSNSETQLLLEKDLIVVPFKDKYIMAIKKEHSDKMIALLSKKEVDANPAKPKAQGNIHTYFINAKSTSGEKMTIPSGQVMVFYVKGYTMLKTYEKTVDGKTCPKYIVQIPDNCLEDFIKTFK